MKTEDAIRHFGGDVELKNRRNPRAFEEQE